jgi:hypothetical protein
MHPEIRRCLGSALICLYGTDWLLSVLKCFGKVRTLVEKFEGRQSSAKFERLAG